MIIPILLITLAVLSFAMAIKTVKEHFPTNSDDDDIDSVESGQLLQIKVPFQNEQTPLAAELFFSALHGLLQVEGDDVGLFSFEIIGTKNGISFYAFVPKRHSSFVETQLYAQYPTAEITKIEKDYTIIDPIENPVVQGTEVVLEKPYYYPIKSFPDFKVDPLAALTGSMEDMKDNQRLWFQMIIRPLPEGWGEPGYRKIESLRKGTPLGGKSLFQILTEDVSSKAGEFLRDIVMNMLMGPKKREKKDDKKKKHEMSEEDKSEIEAIKRKLSLLGFEVNMRLIGIGNSELQAQDSVTRVVAAMKQFSSGELNSFTRSEFVKDTDDLMDTYKTRSQPVDLDSLFILNTEELASVYHLPNVSVATPNIDYIYSKKAQPPLNLPLDTDIKIARTTFRNNQVTFGLKPSDRRRHMYVIGKTGVGKSTLLENMIIRDIDTGKGLAVIDPHGDLIDHVLDYVPEERIKDVIIFDPSDIQYPVALNMFEMFDPDQKGLVASGLVDVFRKRFEFSWGPRMEHLLRNVFLTFLEVPNSTLLGVPRILVDRPYRRYIVHLLQDPVLKEFWNSEFENMAANERMAAEAVAPIQNRLGPFLATPTIRNLVGQAQGTVDLPDIMNSGKILLANLSKGKIGEDNSAILGSFLVSRLWFATLTRASIPEADRRDFYVYVDEFQNFASSSFATILSESRKYRMSLIMAHQYISQLEPGGESTVRDAVFGNVGTFISFVVGQEDAEVLAKQYEPVLTATDIMSLGSYQIYLKLMIDNMQSLPFSAVTLPPMGVKRGFRDRVIENSRKVYGRPRDKVEDAIRRWATKTFAPGMDDSLVVQQRNSMYKKFQSEPEESSSGSNPV